MPPRPAIAAPQPMRRMIIPVAHVLRWGAPTARRRAGTTITTPTTESTTTRAAASSSSSGGDAPPTGRRAGTTAATATTTTRAAANSSSGGDTPPSGASSSSSTSATSAAVAQGYWTLASPMLDVELVVKKSRFIASAWPVSAAVEAQSLIAAASDPSASHNCWAYRLPGGAGSRSSDDGEPGGTAGRPILGAVEADGLEGVAVLVVRFFGGAKLGAGPLARAYAQAARDAVRAAPKAFVRAMARARVVAPPADVGVLYAVLQRLGATAVGEPDFFPGEGEGEGEGGGQQQQQQRLALEVSVAADRAQALAAAMSEATAGRARTELVVPNGGDSFG